MAFEDAAHIPAVSLQDETHRGSQSVGRAEEHGLEGLQARTGAKKAEDEESESGEKYDVYGMHRSSFVAGKLQARFMADNHRFLNVPAHLPQACQTYRAITEQVLQTCNR